MNYPPQDPTLTRDMIVDKFFYDLTQQEQDMLTEAHEMASYAYDMVNIILEIK